MKMPRFGCLTSTGIIAGLIATFLIVGTAVASGGSMYSPGALNASAGDIIGGVSSHAEIEGDCASCHTAPWESETMDDRCSTCHTDVAEQLKDSASVHGGMMEVEPNAKCRDCHTEHHGADALLTMLGNFAFPHSIVGYSLEAHQFKAENDAFLCEDCHGGDITKFEPAICSDCHTQKDMAFMVGHMVTFGDSCLECHDGVDKFGADFDHNKFDFKLAGKHSEAACLDCHAGAHTEAALQATEQACASCHGSDDPHNGKLGTDCASCHSPEDWKPSSFDHARSDFKLDGAHTKAECSKCHSNSEFKGTPKDCFSCHKQDDNHKGQLGTDCAACHVTSDWKDVTFDHDATSFQLTGLHANVKCASCHVNGVYKNTPKDCYSCHAAKDNHKGQFGTNCALCHTTSGWSNISFNHSKTKFPLEGTHTTTDCLACHEDGNFKDTPKDCYSCHAAKDNHKGQFGTNCASCHKPTRWLDVFYDHSSTAFPLTGSHTNVDCKSCHVNGTFKNTPKDCFSCHAAKDNHKGQFGTSCGSCHKPTKWKEVFYDHSTTAFPLTGSHTNVTCKSCHVNGTFKNTPKDCFSCHAAKDNHKGQFGTNCGSCHKPTKWSEVYYDHSSTAFPLTGSHTSVACKSCHVNGDYKNTPKDCYSCHAAKDNHNGQFGTNCGSCHKTTKWSDVFYDHSTTAFPLTGSHTTVACKACHVNGNYKNTPKDCYSCHAAKDKHNGQYGKNCESCHKPTKWNEVTFDHNTTAFPLVDSHKTVECLACHKNGTFKGTPKDCYSCHAPKDKHNGQFGKNCETCHKPTKWSDVTFDHNVTAFPLVDSHKTVACAACHVNGVYKGTPKDCYSCHAPKDKHNGQYGKNCETCHKPTKWSDVTFDHSASAFPLLGKHTNVACSACHVNGVYVGTPKDCYSCHAPKDKHNGQYGTNCARCHTPTGWGNITFDHAQSPFPLTGAHVNTACTKCHVNGVFTGTPRECVSCHASKDVHAGKAGATCSNCHNTSAWKPANFAHSFPLRHEGNKAYSCVTCHPGELTVYTCYGCHEHTSADMIRKHSKVRDFTETTCANCHPDGKD